VPLTTTIRPAQTAKDIRRCFPVLLELRPHLQVRNFLPAIRRLQKHGYFLVRLEAGVEVVAVAGYRFGENLARGKFLYVDDFVTRSDSRRHGHGKKLFDWLIRLARRTGCRELHLDSGRQRIGAHAFYEKQNLLFASRHYSIKLKR
jgi:GNAT superfamily N-acetyltransferase